MTTAFDLSAQLIDDLLEADPLLATSLGLPGRDHLWGDLGIAGETHRTEIYRRYREALGKHLADPDDRQRRAARVLTASLGERIEAFEHGDHLQDLRHMAGTFQRTARIFDVMSKDEPDAWEAIATRLETIGDAYAGLQERLEAGRRSGATVARRQVESVITQAEALAGDGSSFESLAARAAADSLATDRLVAAVAVARAAAGEFGRYLSDIYLPDAREHDGVGEDRYRRDADRFVGITVDPQEAYEWGWTEFHRLVAEMQAVAGTIVPGAGIEEARHHLETDPAAAAHSPEEFTAFILDREVQALEQLEGTHFDVAGPLRTITVNIAPPGGPLGAYYVRPSEDFTRPGGVWYSVGDQTVFPLYHHVSTAYHEGFPGHHLQTGTAMVNADRISRAHRLAVWYPGYGEGWALYAERLMHELGYFEQPGYHFGMLAKHLYRATRVVVDIGLHLGLRIPDGAPLGGGEAWTFARATEYMRVYGFRTPDQAEAEVLRYLGWPGQAIAYKLGEREILSIRDEARRLRGPEFDLKQFHDRVIGNGAMRLDLLREVVLDESA